MERKNTIANENIQHLLSVTPGLNCFGRLAPLVDCFLFMDIVFAEGKKIRIAQRKLCGSKMGAMKIGRILLNINCLFFVRTGNTLRRLSNSIRWKN